MGVCFRLRNSFQSEVSFVVEHGTSLALNYVGISARNPAKCEVPFHCPSLFLYPLPSLHSGASSASPRGDSLATTNLYDGIDWYSLQKPRYTQSSFTHTTILGIRENIILPIIHIHDSSAVLSGGSDGSARIIHTRSGETLQVLEHGCTFPVRLAECVADCSLQARDIVQALVSLIYLCSLDLY